MSSLLECAVCLETLQDPHLLASCGHTFCRRCIDALQPAVCPLCRVPFNRNQIAPNFSVQHLLEGPAPVMGGAVAAPKAAEPPSKRFRTTAATISAGNFQALCLPPALSKLLAEQESDVCLRLYLLDNSGSMSCGDGGIVRQRADGSICRQNSSRWEELVEVARCHAEWNGALSVC